MTEKFTYEQKLGKVIMKYVVQHMGKIPNEVLYGQDDNFIAVMASIEVNGMVTPGTAQKAVKEYVKWVLGREEQELEIPLVLKVNRV